MPTKTFLATIRGKKKIIVRGEGERFKLTSAECPNCGQKLIKPDEKCSHCNLPVEWMIESLESPVHFGGR